ncbi:hypothetical protein M0G74_07275 [Microbulbifer sp. CAU 1566]|uniref:DUF6988 family protein n=1 Tax=Microbulbifer sp. CAU 1566 TaxID=2933269 RepID=UPI002005142D|nr:hypothetical protein [Microbulbifer sp. CAU 1566]MCK7597074.1 hypothetical protein [Microbulbifer sp. CAU 1566]
MEQLLRRSFQLESEVARLFDLPLPAGSQRAWASKVMSSIALEHASSAKLLIQAGNKTSAISLFRLQFEALIRGKWVLHAASETKVSALCELINESNFPRLNNQQASMGEMLKELTKVLPTHRMRQLEEFRDSSWKPLCSMVHGGVLALQTHAYDFPPDLLRTIVKHSNGMSCLTANLLTIISADNTMAGYTTRLSESYRDCLPIAEMA